MNYQAPPTPERIRYQTARMLTRGEDIHEFAFSPDGKYLASGFQNRVSGIQYIYLWDVPDFIPTADTSTVLRFSPDGRLLISGHLGGFRSWANDVNMEASSPS